MRSGSDSTQPAVRVQSVAKELSLEAPMVSAGWRQVENGLTRRLAVDLSGPSDETGSVALLAAMGCLACALLLWRSWQAGQLREDA